MGLPWKSSGSPSNAGGEGLTPGQRAKIPHAYQPKNQNIKQKQYCTKFNEDFLNGLHQKKKKKPNNTLPKKWVNYNLKKYFDENKLLS